MDAINSKMKPIQTDRDTEIRQQQQQMQMEKERYVYRGKKLKESNKNYFRVLFLLAVLQMIAIAFFTRGFLLSREVLPNRSTCIEQQGSETCFRPKKPFKKAIILLIDALRFDFTIPTEEDGLSYHNELRVLYETAERHPENAVLLKFLADPPTTTLQRLKGLTTGSLPTFVDAGSNFNGDTILEDNLIRQLYEQGRRVAFVGDDTWDALFGPYLYRNLTFPYESLNVWDLYTVDEGVTQHVESMLEHNSTAWDVLVGHFLGVDHCGHRYGPGHEAMRGKLRQLDSVIRRVMHKMDNDTVLFVFGDHGMDATGNHGGETAAELESALFMYSKRAYFGHLDGAKYDITQGGSNYRAVDQIDFVPTASLLLGVPVPYNSLGRPIAEAFLGPSGRDFGNLARAMSICSSQINLYRHTQGELASDGEVNAMYAELGGDGNSFRSEDSSKYEESFKYEKAGENENSSQYEESSKYQKPGENKSSSKYDKATHYIKQASQYQQESLRRCKQRWATFDDANIAIGLLLLAISWFLLIVYSKMIPSVVIAQLNPQFLFSSLVLILVYTVLLASFVFVFRPARLPLPWALLLGVALGISNGIFAPVMDRYSVPWLAGQLRDNLIQDGWTYFALFVLLLHSLVFASNSFIVWEDRIVSFWLVTFGICAFFKSFQVLNRRARYLGAFHSLVFVVLTRAVSQIRLCREEQAGNCLSTFATTPYAVAGLYVVAVVLPKLVAAFFRAANCYQGAAPVWISTGFRAMLFLNAFTWTFELFEHDPALISSLIPHSSHSLLSSLSFPSFLKTARLTLARIVIGVSLVAANFGWANGPLCVKIDIQDRPKRAKITGYGNAYGSSYFLLFLNLLAATMEASRPMAALSLAVFTYQLLTLLELVHVLNIRTNLVSAVVLTLLAYLHFFTTGHQATLQSIHWDSAFLLSDSITFPFTHLAVVLDTFAPFLLAALATPLLILWRRPPSGHPLTIFSKIVEVATSFLVCQVSLTWASMLMTNHFRRHLMVWKIFAPRYMLNGMVLIVLNLVVVFVCVGFAAPRVIRRWYDAFGA